MLYFNLYITFFSPVSIKYFKEFNFLLKNCQMDVLQKMPKPSNRFRLILAEVRILNSNLPIKIRTKEGSFRVLSHMVQNLNSKLGVRILNSNLLQKTKQSTSKKERLKLKLIKLELQMKTFALSLTKPKTKKKKQIPTPSQPK